jgi:hypothetical protein
MPGNNDLRSQLCAIGWWPFHQTFLYGKCYSLCTNKLCTITTSYSEQVNRGLWYVGSQHMRLLVHRVLGHEVLVAPHKSLSTSTALRRHLGRGQRNMMSNTTSGWRFPRSLANNGMVVSPDHQCVGGVS